jgi:hypothetical protein
MAFWILVLASMIASATLIYFDDGQRTFAASIPLLCLLASLGFTGPLGTKLPSSEANHSLLRFGQIALAATIFLFLSIPWLSHRLFPDGIAAALKPGEAIVFGGRRMTGFLILPDDQELRSEVPSLHISTLRTVVAASGVEQHQGLINPVMPPLPFGLISAPRLDRGGDSGYVFIVPAEVVERREVAAWRFHVKEWQVRPALFGYYFLYVTRAEPLG